MNFLSKLLHIILLTLSCIYSANTAFAFSSDSDSCQSKSIYESLKGLNGSYRNQEGKLVKIDLANKTIDFDLKRTDILKCGAFGETLRFSLKSQVKSEPSYDFTLYLDKYRNLNPESIPNFYRDALKVPPKYPLGYKIKQDGLYRLNTEGVAIPVTQGVDIGEEGKLNHFAQLDSVPNSTNYSVLDVKHDQNFSVEGIRLECNTGECRNKFNASREELGILDRQEKWSELARLIATLNTRNTLAYYYLAKSALKLGHYDASMVYMGDSEGVGMDKSCIRPPKSCSDLDIESEFSEFSRIVFNEKSTGNSSAALKNSNKADVVIKADSSQPTSNLTSELNKDKNNDESVSSPVETIVNWDLKKENISNFDKEFSKLVTNRKLKKDKYESSDEYKSRLNGLGINNELKLFINLKDHPTKYNPDTQIFNYSQYTTLRLLYEDDYFDHSMSSDEIYNQYKENAIFELLRSSSKVGSYVGSNAFGAKRTVRKFKDVERAVAFPSNAEFVNSNSEAYSFDGKPNKSFSFIKGTIYKSGDKASGGNVGSLMLNIRISKALMKKIEGELGLVYVGNLRMPFYLQSSNLITPEISSPVEINTTYRALYINPTEMLVVLPKSNEILIRFKADSYQVNPKYTEEVSL